MRQLFQRKPGGERREKPPYLSPTFLHVLHVPEIATSARTSEIIKHEAGLDIGRPDTALHNGINLSDRRKITE